LWLRGCSWHEWGAHSWGARVTSFRVLTKHVEMIVPTIALCACTPKDGCGDAAAALDDDDADGRRTKFSLSWKKMIFHSLSAAYDRSNVTGHMSQVTGHRSQVTRHTSHVTRHTSQATYHLLIALHLAILVEVLLPLNPLMSNFSKVPMRAAALVVVAIAAAAAAASRHYAERRRQLACPAILRAICSERA